MGLDMYLTASKYIGGWEHSKPEEKALFQKIIADLGITTHHTDPGSPSVTVKLTVAYWRKANQIHQWFVDHVQDGEDQQREFYVSREQLQQLVETCKQVLADHSKAEELLPPQSGFFFGSTDLDEYYFMNIQQTVTRLEWILADKTLKNDWDFEYHASW